MYREPEVAQWLRLMSDHGSLPAGALTPFMKKLMAQYADPEGARRDAEQLVAPMLDDAPAA
jgi:hypothetical protein